MALLSPGPVKSLICSLSSASFFRMSSTVGTSAGILKAVSYQLANAPKRDLRNRGLREKVPRLNLPGQVVGECPATIARRERCCWVSRSKITRVDKPAAGSESTYRGELNAC